MRDKLFMEHTRRRQKTVHAHAHTFVSWAIPFDYAPPGEKRVVYVLRELHMGGTTFAGFDKRYVT